MAKRGWDICKESAHCIVMKTSSLWTIEWHLRTILVTVNPSGVIHARDRHLLAIHRRRGPRPRFPPLQFHPLESITPLLQLRRAPRARDFKLENESADEDGKHVSNGYDGGVQETDE